MDRNAFNAGKTAYMKGDYATAQAMLSAAKEPGEINGALDHMLGNAFMKMGMFQDAIAAYRDVLKDNSYAKIGAINTNLGRALSATGQDSDAILALDAALQDPTYETRYKAQMALGKLLQKRGDARAAGAAFRAAAIDERNPDPSIALVNLGSCFMELGRPLDAIEAFRTALDFSSEATSQQGVYACLGEAFVAANKMREALDAFQHAEQGGTFQFNSKQEAAYTAAKNAVQTLLAKRSGASTTDDLLAASGYGTDPGLIDPLDPLGQSGEFIPDPEDTGFFDLVEQEVVEQDALNEQYQKKSRKERKAQKKSKKSASSDKKPKKKHHVAGILGVIVLILVLAAAALGVWGYFEGYGIPDAPSVTQSLFSAKLNGTDMNQYIAPSVSDSQKQSIEAILPVASQSTITGVQRATNKCIVTITSDLTQGTSQSYVVSLVRDGITWKVNDVAVAFDNSQYLTKGSNTQDSTSQQQDQSNATQDGSSGASSDASASSNASGTASSSSTSSGGSTTDSNPSSAGANAGQAATSSSSTTK